MSLFGSFDIGKKSLAAAQLGTATTGHNIANVDTEGFSRQEVTQRATRPDSIGRGTGVGIEGIRRHHDIFTKEKVVGEQSQMGTWDTREQILTETEVIFTDLEGNRLRGALDQFWASWRDLAHQPESVPHRKALMSNAKSLTDRFQLFDQRLSEMRDQLNGRIAEQVLKVNQLTEQIADLNRQVQQLEDRGKDANDARDRREMMLQELSNLVEVRYFESDRGTLEVQIPNGQALVHGRDSFALVPATDAEYQGDFRMGLMTATGVVNDVTDIIKGGEIKEYINQRDGNLKDYQSNLNLMAKELAFQVNIAHSGGTGINAKRFKETSAYSMNAEAVEMPLPFLKQGSFEMKVFDKDGNFEQLVHVDVEEGVDSARTIVEKVNRASGAYEKDPQTGEEKIRPDAAFKALINKDGSVTFQSELGREFVYAGDSSNTLAVLGFNSFFQSLDGAKDMRVNQDLLDDEMKVAVGNDMNPSDNTVAMKIVELQTKGSMNEGTQTFDEFYNTQITDIGLKVQDAQSGVKNHGEILATYEGLRDSVSAVNLDEEMANMVKYQRAYESGAKFMSTVDQMTNTLINM